MNEGLRLRDYVMVAAVVGFLVALGFCAGYFLAILVVAVRSLGGV